MVNLCEHQDGKKPSKDLSLAEALSGKSPDPCVGTFLEFRIVRDPAKPDLSQVPRTLIPNPDLSKIPVARERDFEFGRGGNADEQRSDHRVPRPVGHQDRRRRRCSTPTSAGSRRRRNSARARSGRSKNGGGGWDHPIHIHFEEGQILARNGSAGNVPAWERGRKDVYRLRPGGSVTITMQFRDFGGMFMEHCHNTVHEDNAMLLRWEIDEDGAPRSTRCRRRFRRRRACTFITPDDILPTATERTTVGQCSGEADGRPPAAHRAERPLVTRQGSSPTSVRSRP